MLASGRAGPSLVQRFGGPVALTLQLGLLLLLAAAAWWLVGNARDNLAASGFRSGFEFLGEPAGFDIPQTLVSYSPRSTHARVFLVGALNTLLVAVLGVMLATVLGFVLGVLRLSGNLLGRGLSTVYVEVVRNTPLPIQLLIWFNLALLAPPPSRALQPVPGVFLTNRGLFFPWAGETPRLEGFGFEGGAALSPALTALLAALVVYTAAFIAEVVRGGIQSVPPGQAEAARALGLGPAARLRRVILPQALRVMVPSMASQYLNLTKNSSLAIVVGYPDLVSVFGSTSLTRTGQAIETIALIMAFYAAVSLAISALLNGWNARVARREAR